MVRWGGLFCDYVAPALERDGRWCAGQAGRSSPTPLGGSARRPPRSAPPPSSAGPGPAGGTGRPRGKGFAQSGVDVAAPRGSARQKKPVRRCIGTGRSREQPAPRDALPGPACSAPLGCQRCNREQALSGAGPRVGAQRHAPAGRGEGLPAPGGCAGPLTGVSFRAPVAPVHRPPPEAECPRPPGPSRPHALRALLTTAGAQFWCLPPSSPALNPLALPFATLQHGRCRAPNRPRAAAGRPRGSRGPQLTPPAGANSLQTAGDAAI